MTTNIGIYRGLKEKFDPSVHIGFYITTDTDEILMGEKSLGVKIDNWAVEEGKLKLWLTDGNYIESDIPEATENEKGLLSAADKVQLNLLSNNLEEIKTSIGDTSTKAQLDLDLHIKDSLNPHNVTKLQVGLGNVTNDALVKRSEMGVANGVATLNDKGQVPSSLLPSYVDDIIDVYAVYSKSDTGALSNIELYEDAEHSKSITGEAGKIYLNIESGEPSYQFRWTGTAFAQTGASSLIIGEVSGTAYDGAKGKANETAITELHTFVEETAEQTLVDAVNDAVNKIGILSFGEVAPTLDSITVFGTPVYVTSENLFYLKDQSSSEPVLVGDYNSTEYPRTDVLFRLNSELYTVIDKVLTKIFDSSTNSTAIDAKEAAEKAQKTAEDATITLLGGTLLLRNSEFTSEDNWDLYNTVIDSDEKINNNNSILCFSPDSTSTKIFILRLTVEYNQINAYKNDNFTASIYAKSWTVNDTDYFNININAVGMNRKNYSKNININKSDIPEENWEKFSVTLLNSEVDFDISYVYFSITAHIYGDGKIWFNSPKLERGTIATDWSPNPIDINSSINTVQSELNVHLEGNTSGLNHVPSGGEENQVLVWESDGKAKWNNISNLLAGYEDILAYGVEWDSTVADPHLTRIGNMSFHKSLPIQSLLKGCIAQAGKIIYWLDEDDWRFRKNPSYITVTSFDGVKTYETDDDDIESKVGINKLYVRHGKNIGLIVDAMANTIDIDWIETDETDDVTNITDSISFELGSRLDGYDGTVRVYCPSFYIKSQTIGNINRVWITSVYIDNTWTYLPELLIDAYRSTVLNTVPSDMGYLSTLPVNSAISVVNTETYCRGGSNSTLYDNYLTGNGVTLDIYKTYLGKPRSGLTLANMRSYAHKVESEMLSYDLYKNIFYWLWVIEYANFNSLEAYNSNLTEEGYHLGGMGMGVTNWSGSTTWYLYNRYYALTPCGYLNELGNNTGTKQMTIGTGLSFQVPRWRGFDNPFGDLWTTLDGIIIDMDMDNHTDNMIHIYTCQNPEGFSDSINYSYTKIATMSSDDDGYIKNFYLGTAAHIIPNGTQGSGTTYKCDFSYLGVDITLKIRTLIVGGDSCQQEQAGLGTFATYLYITNIHTAGGFRTVSFPD